MNEPPETADGAAARGFLDRSQQAARFLDLTRQRELAPDEASGLLLPIVAAHLQGLRDPDSQLSGEGPLDDADGLGADDLDADDLMPDVVIGDGTAGPADADDIRIDPSAFSAFRPGAIPPGDGLGRFSFDDDGDVFGDGNGFGSSSPFGSDDGEAL